MFKEGARYKFAVIEGGDEVTFWGVIEKYEHPLIKLQDKQYDLPLPGGQRQLTNVPGKIINVTSSHFVSAEEQA